MTDLVERLKALADQASKVAPGPWESDSEESEGGHGKYNEFVLMDARGYRLCGTENADYRFGEIHTEYDEYGASQWNEPARVLMAFLAALDPTSVTNLTTEITRLREEVERLTGERDEWRSVAQAQTPGGSEFTQPAEVRAYCATLRERHFDILKAFKRTAQAAEARVKELEAALDAAPTDNELLPMARKIGETAGIPNHVERARQCWPTVVAALRSRTEGEG